MSQGTLYSCTVIVLQFWDFLDLGWQSCNHWITMFFYLVDHLIALNLCQICGHGHTELNRISKRGNPQLPQYVSARMGETVDWTVMQQGRHGSLLIKQTNGTVVYQHYQNVFFCSVYKMYLCSCLRSHITKTSSVGIYKSCLMLMCCSGQCNMLNKMWPIIDLLLWISFSPGFLVCIPHIHPGCQGS